MADGCGEITDTPQVDYTVLLSASSQTYTLKREIFHQNLSKQVLRMKLGLRLEYLLH